MKSRPARQPRPLDRQQLDEMALRYVARYATTRAKLARYLQRKLGERGWSGERKPDIDGLVERFIGAGYLDDAAYALGQARSHVARGLGRRRLGAALHAAGIKGEEAAEADDYATCEATRAAVLFARKRRLGPFAREAPDHAAYRRAVAAFARAGHDFDLANQLLAMSPNPDSDLESVLKLIEIK